MLSQKEVQFLQSPNSFDQEYCKALRHRIRGNIDSWKKEILLLESAGYKVTENCNSVMDSRNPEISPNQSSFAKNGLRLPGFEPG